MTYSVKVHPDGDSWLIHDEVRSGMVAAVVFDEGLAERMVSLLNGDLERKRVRELEPGEGFEGMDVPRGVLPDDDML